MPNIGKQINTGVSNRTVPVAAQRDFNFGNIFFCETVYKKIKKMVEFWDKK